MTPWAPCQVAQIHDGYVGQMHRHSTTATHHPAWPEASFDGKAGEFWLCPLTCTYTTFMIQKLLSWTVKGIQTNGKMDWLRLNWFATTNNQQLWLMSVELSRIGCATQLIANRVQYLIRASWSLIWLNSMNYPFSDQRKVPPGAW